MLLDYNAMPKYRIWDGIYGSIYHSDKITIGHIILDEGVVLPEHNHIQEQWSNIIEGEMEFNIGGETHIYKSGMTAYIPSNVPHSGRALTRCKVIDCFHPIREDWKFLEIVK